MLGLEKRHLISMIFKELLMFGFLTISAGVLIGALFDKLIFAFLLKLMKMKVQLVSTFQPGIVILVFVTFGLIFGLLILLNAWRILRLNALQLTREKSSGEKKARFLWPQTILGLAALAFWLLPSCVCQRPHYCACDLLSSRYLGHDRDLPAL